MKRALFVGDLHCGSDVAVMPRRVEEKTDAYSKNHDANELQLALLDFWTDMCEVKYDYMFMMGDLTDGVNYHEHGVGSWTTNLKVQARAAADLLSMVRAKNRAMVYGSTYHVDENLTTEEYVAERLKLPDECHAKELIVEVEDNGRKWNLHLLHEVGVSHAGWNYRATPLLREMLLAEMNRDELDRIHGTIRGHAHYFVEARYGTQFGFITPAWKLRDRFAMKMGLSTVPRTGYVVAEFDGAKNRVYVEPHMLNLKLKGVDVIRKVKF